MLGKGATDRTVYGTTRVSTRSFYTHHTQQMSKAAVMHDAKAIRRQVLYLKQRVFGCAVRATEAGADGEPAAVAGGKGRALGRGSGC